MGWWLGEDGGCERDKVGSGGELGSVGMRVGGYGWSISEVGEDGDGVRVRRGVKMGL